jgi:hypothetical protein
VTVVVDPVGAEVFIDGKNVGKSPLSKPVTGLAPGNHHLVVRMEGYQPETEVFNLAGGDKRQFVIELKAEKAAASQGISQSNTPEGVQSKQARGDSGATAWIIMGVGAATLAVGIGLGVSGELLHSGASQIDGRTEVELQRRRDQRITGQTLSWSGVVGGGVGLALIGVGVGIATLGGDE